MTFTIDENLRDVLEDITTSKKSALFAGTFLKNVHEAYTIPDGRFAAMRLGMGSAERHLLETYRSELSMVLLQGFYKNFFEVEEFASKVHNLGEIPAAEPLEERARFARDSAPRDAFVGKTTHWLRRLLEGRPIAKAEDLESMLTAAIGLRDRPAARVYMGALRFSEGDQERAQLALQVVLHPRAEQSLRRYDAMAIMASSCFVVGDWVSCERWSSLAVRFAWANGDLEGAAAEMANLIAYASMIGEPEMLKGLARECLGLGEMSALRAQDYLSSCVQRSRLSPGRRDEVFLRASECLGSSVFFQEGGRE